MPSDSRRSNDIRTFVFHLAAALMLNVFGSNNGNERDQEALQAYRLGSSVPYSSYHNLTESSTPEAT